MKVFINKEDKKLCGIYCILNTINGKFYIGSTCGETVGFWKRYKDHINSLKRGDHRSSKLQNSFNKNGEDVFQFTILDILPRDKDIILQKEQNYLDALRPYINAIGYNHSKMANCTLRAANKSRYRELLGRPVVAYTLDGVYYKEYNSIAAASDELNVKKARICKACNLKGAKSKNWMFNYVDRSNPYPDNIKPYQDLNIGRKNSKEQIVKMMITKKLNGKKWKFSEEVKLRNSSLKYKPIYAKDYSGNIIIYFESLSDCRKYFKLKSTGVLRRYMKNNKSYKGLFLVYLTKEEISKQKIAA